MFKVNCKGIWRREWILGDGCSGDRLLYFFEVPRKAFLVGIKPFSSGVRPRDLHHLFTLQSTDHSGNDTRRRGVWRYIRIRHPWVRIEPHAHQTSSLFHLRMQCIDLRSLSWRFRLQLAGFHRIAGRDLRHFPESSHADLCRDCMNSRFMFGFSIKPWRTPAFLWWPLCFG